MCVAEEVAPAPGHQAEARLVAPELGHPTHLSSPDRGRLRRGLSDHGRGQCEPHGGGGGTS
jgi:hypothetical protein